MKKLLVVLIVIGFAWTIPQARTRIQEALRPIGEALGPAMDVVLNPTRRAGTAREEQFIMREIENQRQMGRGLPDPGAFHEWVMAHVESVEDGLDPWGQPFYLEVSREYFVVGSAGPDRTIATDDDIRDTKRLPARRR